MLNETIEGFRLSPQQKHLWLLQRGENSGQFSAWCDVEISGSFDEHTFTLALEGIIQRHEVLHTLFRCVAGADIPLQVLNTNDRLYTLRSYDLSMVSPAEQEARLETSKREMQQTALNLEQGPLVFVTLFKLTPVSHRLFLYLPALCADSASLRSFICQLDQEYSSILDKRSESEPDLLQYIDFSQWQSDLLESEEFAPEREFWSEQRRVSLPEACLPFVMRKGEREPFRPESQLLDFSAEVLAQVEALTEREGVSWSTFFLTCWQLLLQRVCMQSALLLGVAHSNRKSQEFEEALGLYAKYLPLSCTADETISFSTLLKQTQEALQNLSNLQEYFDWEPLRTIAKDPADEPFFHFCFDGNEADYQHTSERNRFFQLKAYSAYIDRFHVQLSCVRQGLCARIRLHYDTSVCACEDISELAEQYQVIVISALNNPETPVGNLELLSTHASQRILHDFSKVAIEPPEPRCIHHVFEEHAASSPQHVAVVVEDNQLTYAELNSRANQLAGRLQDLGVRPEVRVGLFIERSCELLVGLLGILKAGGAYVPLDPVLPAERLRYLLQDSQISLVVTQQSLQERLAELEHLKLVELETLSGTSDRPVAVCPESEVQPDNLAYIIYTSGSTGTPKGVAVTHANLWSYVHNMLHLLSLPEKATYAAASTFAADLGHTAIFPALCGGCLHLLVNERANDPEALAAYLQKYPLDCLKIVPSHLASLLTARHPERLLPARWLILGGEATSWEMASRIRALAPHCRLLNHYGPTETTVGVLTYEAPEEDLLQAEGIQRQGARLPLGKPLAGVRVYVLDRRGEPVPI
ncbi:MAG TPA: AMP-binding protein, partial [Ktedonobacteraceae bacterium]|nr:AMP-binding protein [Ktedonobacteraceae bacterium]